MFTKNQNLLKKLIMCTPFAKMLIHGDIRSPPMEITTIEGSNLIPRVINTQIMVYAITSVDIEMESRRRNRNHYYIQNRNNNNNNNNNNNVEVNTTTGSSELHKAASCGNIERVKDAISKNKELLKLRNSEGDLPVSLAVMKGHKEVAIILVKEYPEGSYSLNDSKISPLYHAVHNRDTDLVNFMFEALATHEIDPQLVVDNLNKGKSIVRAAITNNHKDMLEIILKSQPDLVKCWDEEGLTPLSYAAYNGIEEMVKFIITLFPKSVRSYKNRDNSEPIHKACLGANLKVLQMLVSKSSSSLWSEAELGRTALHLAAVEPRNKLKDIVSFLLKREEGIDLINIEDEYGSTPLDLAIHSNNTEIQQLIQTLQRKNY